MAIKRGVSLYSLQEDYYLGNFTLEDCIAKTANEIGATGIELLPDQMPLASLRTPEREISDKDLDIWFGWMDKYKTEPTAYGANFFTTMFANRRLTDKETVYWTKKDLIAAAKMGFKVYRTGIIRHEDIAILSECFGLAEELGIQIATEIHAPRGIHTWWTQDFLNEIVRKNTKAAGFVVDFGIFTKGLSLAAVNKYVRSGANKSILMEIDAAHRAKTPLSHEQIIKCGGAQAEIAAAKQLENAIYDDPQWIKEVLPYTRHCHGKFYEISESLTEQAIDYEGPLRVLKQNSWDGFISSEYEGQRDYFDIGCEEKMDAVEQCRRHHKMIDRILSEI